MTAEELIREVESRGARLVVPGPGQLRLVPKAAATPELVNELRQHKADLIDHLTGLDYQVRFGEPHARLFPYLRQSVNTPSGPGVLVQVFADRAAVVQGGRVVFCLTSEVEP